MQLYNFQRDGLNRLKYHNRCAFYWDMGTGKSFVGAEKAVQLAKDGAILVICQKSKIDDWENHFLEHYLNKFWCDGDLIFNLSKPKQYTNFLTWAENDQKCVGIINYDLIFRRKELLKLQNLTLVLDESSMIQNEKAKRTRAILKLKAQNVVLLSGTPVSGKYEQLWSQCKLLGWNISKSDFWDKYINYHEWTPVTSMFPIKIIDGYKNVDELKSNLRLHGADFLQSEYVLDLPEQVFNSIYVPQTPKYKQFVRDRIVTVAGRELVGDNPLNRLLYMRMLCGAYSSEKLKAFEDWINSNNERLIVFYNFNNELQELISVCGDRPISIVNGEEKELENYEKFDNSITFVQYQAGAMGLNLQKARYLAYYSLPLSSALFEQSKKRIHRIGQKSTCFYYYFLVKTSIEEKILNVLNMRNDFTLELFKEL